MADASPPEGAPLPPPRGAGSVALIAIGLLILVPSGLCTAFFGVGALWDMATGAGGHELSPDSFLWAALIIGGPPIALGTALTVWGVRRARRFKPQRRDHG